jgi:serralysin
MGAGNDTFTGGAKAEQLRDNGGTDTANFGGGRDLYLAAHNPLATDGNDSLNGGKGVDTYDATFSSTAVLINLDTVQHDLSAVSGAPAVAANTAVGDGVAGPGLTDSIVAFENAIGSDLADTIYGTSAMNMLDGGSGGADALFGFGGADTLLGGGGADFLAGGAGKDMLTGGGADAEVDTFAFLALSDSGVTAATRDVIDDFEDGIDQISLAAIDANSSTANNDAFAFIGTNVGFSGTAGELRAYWTVTGQIIEGDVNGDGAADVSIKLTDADHSIVLGSSDFLL